MRSARASSADPEPLHRHALLSLLATIGNDPAANVDAEIARSRPRSGHPARVETPACCCAYARAHARAWRSGVDRFRVHRAARRTGRALRAGPHDVVEIDNRIAPSRRNRARPIPFSHSARDCAQATVAPQPGKRLTLVRATATRQCTVANAPVTVSVSVERSGAKRREVETNRVVGRAFRPGRVRR